MGIASQFKEYLAKHGILKLDPGMECPDCEVRMTSETDFGDIKCQKCGHVYTASDDEAYVSSAPCSVCGDTMQQAHEVFYGIMVNPEAPMVRATLCEDCTAYAKGDEFPDECPSCGEDRDLDCQGEPRCPECDGPCPGCSDGPGYP